MPINFAVMTTFGSRDGVSNTFNKMGQGASRFGNKSKSAFGKASKAGSGFASTMKGILAAGFLVKGFQVLKNGMTSFVAEAQKIEDATAAFTPLMGGAKQANKLVAALNRTAATTPFQFENISKASKQLLPVMDGDIKKTVETFRMLGDTAGGNAQKLDSITRGFTKSMLKGKVDMESLNMIAEAGVPIYSELSASMGVSVSEMMKMSSAGKISKESLVDAFKSMTSEGGIFFKGMEIASQTLTGKLSTLSDNIALTKAAIGTALLPILKPMIDKAISFAGSIREIVTANKDLISEKVSGFFNAIKSAIDTLKPGFVALIGSVKMIINIFVILIKDIIGPAQVEAFSLSAIMKKVGGVFSFVAGIIKNFITGIKPFIPLIGFILKLYAGWVIAQWAINAAMLANPINLIIIGVIALITAIGWLINNWDLVKAKIQEVWNKFLGFLNSIKQKFIDFISGSTKSTGGFFDYILAGISIMKAPLTFLISMVKSLIDNFANIRKAFDSKGILGGIIAIGKALLSGLLAPIESLLNLLSKIPGLGDLAAGAAEKIKGIRAGLFAQEEAARREDAIQSPAVEAPNRQEVEARQSMAFQGRLDIAGAPQGSTFTQKNNNSAPIAINLLGVNP